MNRLLTFEFDEENDLLEIHGNVAGLDFLKKKIGSLIERDGLDHIHMMVSSWGGEELSEEKQCEANRLLPHVKIYKWQEL